MQYTLSKYRDRGGWVLDRLPDEPETTLPPDQLKTARHLLNLCDNDAGMAKDLITLVDLSRRHGLSVSKEGE